MRKVTTINLNNNAYQMDEDGYEALRAYLERAARALAENPDREEILSDLEQAIADKCLLTLGSHKTVVSTAEIERILKEMGPVAGSTDEPAASSGAGAGTSSSSGAGAAPRPRRLYRIREGQTWSGVCTGLAAYAAVDVTWVRVAFVMLAIFGGGFGLLAYIVLIFAMPIANTPEELAAAHGQPVNAQELVDRVKKKHDEWRDGRRGKRRMRHVWWGGRPAQPPPGYAARVTGGVFLPLLTVLSAVWFSAMATVAYIVWQGWYLTGISAWRPEAWHGYGDIPRWVALAAIVAIYAVLAIPIGAGRRASLYYANGGRLHGWADAWSGLLWLALCAVLLLSAWYVLPQLQELLRYHLHGTLDVISV